MHRDGKLVAVRGQREGLPMGIRLLKGLKYLKSNRGEAYRMPSLLNTSPSDLERWLSSSE